MNIIVRSAEGAYFVRPDTTWERDSEDFYPPETVTGLLWTPVLFAHISKPGRSISARFARRYFDGIGSGVLLYPEDQLDGRPDSIARASCLDHTSFLPFPTAQPSGGCRFSVSKDGATLFEGSGIFDESICKAIEEASRYIYLRHGDILALELKMPEMLMPRTDGESEIRLQYNGLPAVSFRIIF